MNKLFDSGLSAEVISKSQQIFTHFSEIEEVVLYGSRAMGNYRIGSDIDITIKLQSEVKPSITLLSKISMAIDDLDLIYSFDISFFSQIDNENLVEHINTQGVIFYPLAQGRV
tara:strand:- start:120 stop:458 length:339 start_codon:yes stop_codon:yes gene_type:complete